ncbi:hypothetical protein [Sporosalibacterium faouarense]|uniref:hypothetical protein n=1 Tax=Sporosalibacterium faouarense TaxID=516123 RepID=UPI00192ABCB3|nr:hypothetical protein [Sporosalibacterium faouarense]
MKKTIVVLTVIALLGTAFYLGLGAKREKNTKNQIKDTNEYNQASINQEKQEKNFNNKNSDIYGKKEDDTSGNINGLTEEDIIRIDNQGAVDIGAIFNNLIEKDDDYLVFKLYVNTHSVDLESIDFAKKASLILDGEKVTEGFSWEIGGGSGHHLKGYLKVNKEYNGKPIFNNSSKEIELYLENIDGIPSRIFKWNIYEINVGESTSRETNEISVIDMSTYDIVSTIKV